MYPKRGNQNISHYRCSSVYGWWKEGGGALVLNKREVQCEVFIQGEVRGCRINKNVSYDFREVLTRFLYKFHPLIVATNVLRFHPCPKEISQLRPNFKIDVNSSVTDNFIKEKQIFFPLLSPPLLSSPPPSTFATKFAGYVEHSLQCVFSLSMRANMAMQIPYFIAWTRICCYFIVISWINCWNQGLKVRGKTEGFASCIRGKISIDITQDNIDTEIVFLSSIYRVQITCLLSAEGGYRHLVGAFLEFHFIFGGFSISSILGSRFFIGNFARLNLRMIKKLLSTSPISIHRPIRFRGLSSNKTVSFRYEIYWSRTETGVKSCLRLNTKRRLLYLKTQFVPRSKHFSSRL